MDPIHQRTLSAYPEALAQSQASVSGLLCCPQRVKGLGFRVYKTELPSVLEIYGLVGKESLFVDFANPKP